MNFLLYFLQKQRNEESKQLQSVIKDEFDDCFLDSDEELEEDDDDEEDVKNIDIGKKVSNINKAIKHKLENIYETLNKKNRLNQVIILTKNRENSMK